MVAEWVKSDLASRFQLTCRYRVDRHVQEGHRISPQPMKASHNALGLREAQLKSVQHHPDGTVFVFDNPKRPRKG